MVAGMGVVHHSSLCMATAVRMNLPDYCANAVTRWNVSRMHHAARTLILGLLVAVTWGMPARAEPGVLVLGRVSDDPKSHYAGMKLLLDHVVAQMQDVGIREGRVLMARDALQMASYLRRGRVDWVSETGAGAVLLQTRAGAETLVLSERNGIRRYRTIYLARRDSDVKSIDDLRGRRIAFQNRTSTSAYYIPAMELLSRHIPLEVLGSLRDQPGPDAAGFLFARTERNIATWVHKGLVDVGAVSNLDWSNPQHIPEFFRGDLVILRESPDVPRGIEVVRKDLDPVVRQRLHDVLVSIGKDSSGQASPELVKQNQRFFDLEERDRRDLQWLRSGVANVSAEIE